MGMTYQFRVAKKSDLPEDLKYYSDAEDKFFDVGPDFDREDWLGGFIRNCADDKCSFNHKAFTAAIEKLKQLDEDVKYVLESKDLNLDIDFRRRLARGLVANIYGYREYHYEYPRSYYGEDSYQFTSWTEDDWKDYESGSSFIQESLAMLLPYANDEYVIWLASY